MPGALPSVWNVRPRNQAFTGRELVLADLRTGLDRNGQATVHALGGPGGVGKTSTVIPGGIEQYIARVAPSPRARRQGGDAHDQHARPNV